MNFPVYSAVTDYLLNLFLYYSFVPIVSIGGGIIFGYITKRINENRGYNGGYWWGFFLGVIGIIVVSCRPSHAEVIEARMAASKNEQQPKVAIPAVPDAVNIDAAAQEGYNPTQMWVCPRCNSENSLFYMRCQNCGLLK